MIATGAFLAGLFAVASAADLQAMEKTSTHYYLVEARMSWVDAEAHCQSTYNTHLATVNSAELNAEAYALGQQQSLGDSVWVGYNDLGDEGRWGWADGSDPTYTNWLSGQPDNAGGKQHCLRFLIAGSWNGQWADRGSDESSFAFLCNRVDFTKSSENFILVETGVSWTDAEAHCQSVYGTHLATTNTEARAMEAYALGLQQSVGDSVWAGYNDMADEGRFTWLDGSDPTYTNWLPGQPDNYAGRQHCQRLLVGGSWKGEWADRGPDESSFAFLCNRRDPTKSSEHYILVERGMSWTEAEAYCQATYGTHLATTNSAELNAEAYALGQQQSIGDSVWAGYNDVGNEGTWTWLDGADNGYTNWLQGQPDNAGGIQHCQRFLIAGSWNGQWADRGPDESSFAFLCNRRDFTASPTASPTQSPTESPTNAPTPSPACNCYQEPNNGPYVPCDETGWAHLQASSGLYWAWASPCSGNCNQLPDPLPYGWRRATNAEFANRPDIYFFGYTDALGWRVYSSSNPNVCAAHIFDDKYNHCDASDYKGGYVTNVNNNHNYETIIVHESQNCPVFSLEAHAKNGQCAPVCSQEFCGSAHANAVCSASMDDLVDPAGSADACRHVMCRDCSTNLGDCVQRCLSREEWFGDNLNCEAACAHNGMGTHRCFNNYS